MKSTQLLPVMLLVALIACSEGGRLPHSFYGKYYSSNGYGHEYLLLLESGLYEQETGGCVGTYSKGSGRYRYDVAEGSILIKSKNFDGTGQARGPELQIRYYLLCWGKRHYAISDAAMPLFLCFVADSTDPHKYDRSVFLVNADDEEKPLGSLSGLPQKWRGQLSMLAAAKSSDAERAANGAWQNYDRYKKYWGP